MADKIQTNKWRNMPITVTTTTGDLASGSITAMTDGDLIFINALNMNRAAVTAVGDNMYEATIYGIPDFYSGTLTIVYSGTTLVVVHMLNNGNGVAYLTAKVLVASLPSNSKITARGFLKLG